MSIGVMVGIAIFVYNKLKSTKVDIAKWAAPLFIALAIYDFISDVNLSIKIFQN